MSIPDPDRERPEELTLTRDESDVSSSGGRSLLFQKNHAQDSESQPTSVDLMRTLYDYNAWANQQILETAGSLSTSQFVAHLRPCFPCVRDNLVHIMSAHLLWLSRWQGDSEVRMLNPKRFKDLDSIQVSWSRLEKKTRAFIACLDESDLVQQVRYKSTQGQMKAFPLWQLMIHQVNHATQHRSEIALALTIFGHSPGLLDIYAYLQTNHSDDGMAPL